MALRTTLSDSLSRTCTQTSSSKSFYLSVSFQFHLFRIQIHKSTSVSLSCTHQSTLVISHQCSLTHSLSSTNLISSQYTIYRLHTQSHKSVQSLVLALFLSPAETHQTYLQQIHTHTLSLSLKNPHYIYLKHTHIHSSQSNTRFYYPRCL